MPTTVASEKTFDFTTSEAEEYELQEGEERSYLDPVAKQVSFKIESESTIQPKFIIICCRMRT